MTCCQSGGPGPKWDYEERSRTKEGVNLTEIGTLSDLCFILQCVIQIKSLSGQNETKPKRPETTRLDTSRLHVNLPQQEAGRCVNGCRIPIRWARTFMASTWFAAMCQPEFHVCFFFLLWQVKIPAVKSRRFSPGSYRDSPGTPNPPRRSRSHTGNMA